MLSSLASAVDRYTAEHPNDSGLYPTQVDGLSLFRSATTEVPVHALYPASVCVVVQGAKTCTVGDDIHEYDEGDGLFVCVDVPALGRVTRASPQAPYLAVVIDLDFLLLAELALHDPGPSTPTPSAEPGTFVGRIPERALNAIERLVDLLETPSSISFLAPGILREVTYWLLQGPNGDALRQLGQPTNPSRRIADAVASMKQAFPGPVRVEALAEAVHMSLSSFYTHFRTATGMTPIQYYKRLRLLEARRMLTTGEAARARDTAFRVGYESPSQFSRDYTRTFGSPPSHDIVRAVA
ncbi:MAG: AraC family transcriptional regulator [Bacteroidota bacterium]